ncbi:MAG: beta-ketoacyl-ACP synthase II [Phycisphaerales bacterium]|nr:beta-ketoacyl-ACP synthase II [Planctomycetota bacterium]MCH8507556.1 beta-ketoacyl-ACP synthase II [Phycisphaerales bacterium]
MTHSHGRRVVITGYGALTDLAHTAPGSWAAMRDGRSGIRSIDLPNFDDFQGWTVRIAGQVRDWTPDFLEHREAKRIDRCTLLGMGAAEEAVRHCGLDFTAGDPTRRGIVIGSGIGGIQTIEDGVVVLHSKGPARLSPFTVPRLMVNAVTGNISIRFNLQGPASAHATACASSGHAIGDAMGYIRRGHADVMIAGGAEAAVTPLCVGAFMTMKALSTRNDAPEKASRPFDVDRDGFVLAEGAAMFVLESEEHARARGATILGELVGFGNSSDAGHITAPDAEGRGAGNAMKWALEDAGLNQDQIDYINAHGTSTPLGDKAEVAAVKKIFGERSRLGGGLVMSSTKSIHGHTLGASGAVEMIACLHAINDSIVAPTINLDTIDPDCDGIDLVPNTAREMPVRYAMNNTFGFGGHNVTLICGKYQG